MTARDRASRNRVEIQWGDGVADSLAEEPPPDVELEAFAESALELADGACELCVRLVDEGEIRQLNRKYRDQDEVTNVLAFPCDFDDEAGTRLLGDVVICAARVVDEAVAQHKSFEAHWAHLVIHGVLHLLGYDHHGEEERGAMEEIEVALLAHRGYANPYEITQ